MDPQESRTPPKLLSGRLWRWAEAPWIDQAWVERTEARSQRFVWWGYWCQVAFGVLAAAAMAMPSSWVEICAAPLAVTFMTRIWVNWRAAVWAAMQPVVLLTTVAAAWLMLSLLWSPASSAGATEVRDLRFAVALMFLMPVLRFRRVLVIAYVVGFLPGVATQIGSVVGELMGVEGMNWGRMPGRHSGWFQPVRDASWLVGWLGLNLPVALMGRGWWRIAGSAGTLLALFAIAATGTRGAWLAAMGLVVIVGAYAVLRIRPVSRMVLVCGGGVLLLVAGAGATWVLAGESVASRADAARVEIRSALADGNYESDTGARILMGRAAIDAFVEHPVRGVGAGGFEPYLREFVEEREIEASDRVYHDHAHSTLLHIGATQGLVGLAVWVLLAVVIIRSAFVQRPWVAPGTYPASIGFALLGILLAGTFDTVHLTLTMAHVYFLAALCAPKAPEPIGTAGGTAVEPAGGTAMDE